MKTKKYSKNPKAQAVKTTKLPKAQWADDSLSYRCGSLISCCTRAVRELADQAGFEAIVTACESTIVCATVSQSHFSYSDEASLAERIGACNELATCCEALLAAIGDSDLSFVDMLKAEAQATLDQCRATAGTEEEEEDGPAHSEEAQPEQASTAVVGASAARAAGPKNPNWLKVEAKADGVHMSVYGFIGADVLDDSGTSGAEFTNALAKIKADQHIHLHVDSEGGSLADGMAIFNALKARRPNVTTYVDGVALSCASLVALAGDKVISPKSSVWMIHSARISTYGDTEEHKKAIKMLNTFSDMMADVYAEETGHDKDEVLKLMEAESWFTGAEAVEFGLADALDDDASGEDHVPAEDPDQVDEEGRDKEHDWPGACARARAVFAMYRPPENIRQILSVRNHAVGAAGQPGNNRSNMKDTTTVAAPATTASNPFEARLVQERTARITAEVSRRAEGRNLKNEQVQFWNKTALASMTSEDEQQVYAQIDALPKAVAGQAGGAPLAETQVQTPEARGTVRASELRWGDPTPRPRTPFAEGVRRLPTATERRRHHVRAWGEHLSWCMKEDLKAMGGRTDLPVGANTYSSTLVTDFLEDVATTILTNRWAALSCVSRDFSTDRYKPLATAQCKLVTAGSTTLTGTKSSQITNFETGDSTVTPVPVSLNHYSQPFHVSQDEMMNGLRLENLLTINLAALADTIIGNVMNCLVVGGYNSSGSLVAFSAGTCNAAAGTFTWNSNPGVPKLWAYLKKSPIKNLVLDGVYLANLINNPYFYQETFNGERASDRAKVFGWDNIQANTSWPSSLTNLGGIALNPQAIFAVSGLPQMPPVIPGATLQESVMTIPGPDISLANYLWFSLGSRTMWNSFDVMFGSHGGDASALAMLFNQAGSVS